MFTALFIGIPVFMILAGTLAALAFSVDPAEEQTTTQPAVQARPQPSLTDSLSMSAAPVVYSDPANTSTTADVLPVDELLQQIENHLRQERAAAAEFARDPSSRSLWLN